MNLNPFGPEIAGEKCELLKNILENVLFGVGLKITV
jgi:hypothetical protein